MQFTSKNFNRLNCTVCCYESEQHRTMQTQAITYRHDLRHHCTYLQALASAGDLEKITDYLNAIQPDIMSLFTDIAAMVPAEITEIIKSKVNNWMFHRA